MTDHIYIFGFDNTLVNSEDLLVDIINRVLNISMTKEFWYTHLHNAKDFETEKKLLEETFCVNFSLELQQKAGEEFIQTLVQTPPNKTVCDLMQKHLDACQILTGSPADIVQMYLKQWSIDLPEDRLHAGIYNASGEKEKILRELQKNNNVIYIDDDPTVVKNAASVVEEVYLVKQSYNRKLWSEFKTLELQ